MKKCAILLLLVALTMPIFAQTMMMIQKNNGTTDSLAMSDIKNISFKRFYVAIPSKGLVAYYPFNGNANDESGNGYNAVSYGATLTSDRFSNPNAAYQFDGTSAYIDIPGTESLNFSSGGFTLCAWAKFTEDSYGWSVLGKHYHGYANGYSLDIGAPRAELHVDGQYAFDTTASLMGAWHFVVGTFDGSTGRFYADGQLRATQTITYVHTNAVTITMGAFHNAGVGNFFKGSIDDVRIYNRALTDSEVAALAHEAGW